MKILIAITLAVVAVVRAEDLSKYSPNEIVVIPDIAAPLSPRIVGGNEAIPHSYPHSVAVYINGNSFCGGSVIKEDVILTAAHCVDSARTVEVVAGGHNINQNEETQQRVKSTKFVVHEDWDRSSLVNDIALVKLDSPLQLNENVQPIALDDGECLSTELDGTSGTVSGWGRYGGSGGISPVLREVTSTLLSNTECRRYFNIIKDTHICLDGTTGKGSCNGDSGGCLLGTRNNKKVEVGIVSFGSGWGCQAGFPTAYTRVACFNSWVTQNA